MALGAIAGTVAQVAQGAAKAPKGPESVVAQVVQSLVGGDSARVSGPRRLDAAGEKFGAALAGLSPEDKQAMQQIHQQVEAYAAQQESQGRKVDRASLFAGEAMKYALNKDPEGKNPGLMGVFDAGAEYVDAYKAALQEGK
ncbi:MAG: hypothetical protein AB1758_31110 [Candidatus Eremiobacterota bacterium]